MSALSAVSRTAFRSAKVLVERSIVGAGIPGLTRAGRRADVLVLAYHNVVPHGGDTPGDVSLHLPQEMFGRQLDSLLQTHDVVPLSSLFDPAAGRRPRAVITFDDAYAGAVEAGVEELVRRGLPATVFVAPAFIDGGTFWWDEIADAPAGCVPAPLRKHCLQALEGRSDRILSWADARGMARNALASHQRVCAETSLARAAAHPGITLAAHTWSHPNLTALAPSQLWEELVRPLEWLRERFERVVPWLSYPYGLYSGAVSEAARTVGYKGAFRVDGGWLRAGAADPRHALPRLNIPSGLSLNGFEIRASGMRVRS